MRKICLLLLAALLAAAGLTACKTNQGAREFIPGKGEWTPVK